MIIGLVGSGKTTLYRKLNENRIYNAVEIELPQSCISNERLKRELFLLYMNDDNIDCIIVHPYYLSDVFKTFDLDISYLNVPKKERIRRIMSRCKSLGTDIDSLFPKDFLNEEEKYFKSFLKQNEITLNNNLFP